MNKTIKYDALQSQILGDIPTHSIDLFLIHCGYHKCPPNYIFDHHELNEYHLHFVLNGKGTLIINENKYLVKKNDIFILPKNYIVKYYADSNDPWEYIWVTFDGTLAETYLSHANITAKTPVVHSNISNETYLEYVDKILEAHEFNFSNELKRASFLFELLSTLIESQNDIRSCDSISNTINDNINIYSNISSTVHSYVDAAIDFIVKNYTNTTVNDIANYIGINRSYLCTIFKKQLNISPQRYLLSFRMKKAEELIRTTQETICDIAKQVGYNDSLVFSKIFKKTYGLSPANYRNQFVNKEKV